MKQILLVLLFAAVIVSLSILPAFSDDDHAGESSFAEMLHKITVPAGFAAFSAYILTLLAGLFIKKNRNKILPWHMRLGILTGICASLHLASMLLR